jgi:hypothetical protein
MHISTQIDVKESIDKSREHVSGCDLPLALFKLAFGWEIVNPKNIRDEVVESAKNDPLLHLFNGAIIDQQGRPIARKQGLLSLTGPAYETALEAEAFSHAARYYWGLRSVSFINPAREQIYNEHKPSGTDLLFFVENNPFIPLGHEGIFLQGLQAGFYGDFLTATHLLTPQIENSLRYVLESNGVDVSNLIAGGTQPVKVLGAIFDLQKSKDLFGESLCFELRGCLIEKTGYDLRNRVAHGFIDDNECYSAAAINMWWLVLRMCMIPFYNKHVKRIDDPKQENFHKEMTPPNHNDPSVNQ